MAVRKDNGLLVLFVGISGVGFGANKRHSTPPPSKLERSMALDVRRNYLSKLDTLNVQALDLAGRKQMTSFEIDRVLQQDQQDSNIEAVTNPIPEKKSIRSIMGNIDPYADRIDIGESQKNERKMPEVEQHKDGTKKEDGGRVQWFEDGNGDISATVKDPSKEDLTKLSNRAGQLSDTNIMFKKKPTTLEKVKKTVSKHPYMAAGIGLAGLSTLAAGIAAAATGGFQQGGSDDGQGDQGNSDTDGDNSDQSTEDQTDPSNGSGKN